MSGGVVAWRAWRVAVCLLLAPLAPAVATALWHPKRPDWAALRAPDDGVSQVDIATAWREFSDALG